MIIQCEQCNTKFRLDDSKVKDSGVKVRCAKCKHVFTVFKEQQEPEASSDFGSMLDQGAGGAAVAAAAATVAAPPPLVVPELNKPFQEFPAGTADSFSFGSENTVFSSESKQKESTPFAPAAEEPDQSADADDFSFPTMGNEKDFSPSQHKTTAEAGEVDFSSFDFGDSVAETGSGDQLTAAKTVMDVTAAPEPPAMNRDTEPDYGFDFGDESLFGDVVAPPAAEEPTKAIKFDLEMEEFADSMGIQTPAGDKGTTSEPAAEEPFSLGEIDFGDELSAVAVQQINPDELKPAQDLFFAPLIEPTAKTDQLAEVETVAQTAAPEMQDELPPLSIASRRKQGPLLKVLMGAAGAALIALLGFFGYSQLSEQKSKTSAADEKITVRAVDASFVKSKESGDLLVITGEAVNDFKTPRAALQVKGMIYGANGQVLASKNAFAGNPLTKEQLATMPMEKVEAAMANQFGDSLSNLEVASGKAIPFVIVLAKPEAEAKDYGVEPAGSTVSTGKQK